MASRAWASAEAVTVQVLTTMMSAEAGVEAEVQPRSSNWRSRAAPSACVARQPNCWMKKLGIWNHGIEAKKQFTQSSRSAQSPQRRKDSMLAEYEPMQRRPRHGGLVYKDSGFGGVRKERQQSRPELGQDLPLLAGGCAATIFRHPWPINDTTPPRWTIRRSRSLFPFTTRNRRSM